MSVFYGVRLTEELSAKIEATGRGKTAVITAALEAYFEVETPAKSRSLPKPLRGILKPGATIPPIVEAAFKPQAASEKCLKPDHMVFRKGDGWFCATCAKEKK